MRGARVVDSNSNPQRAVPSRSRRGRELDARRSFGVMAPALPRAHPPETKGKTTHARRAAGTKRWPRRRASQQTRRRNRSCGVLTPGNGGEEARQRSAKQRGREEQKSQTSEQGEEKKGHGGEETHTLRCSRTWPRTHSPPIARWFAVGLTCDQLRWPIRLWP